MRVGTRLYVSGATTVLALSFGIAPTVAHASTPAEALRTCVDIAEDGGDVDACVAAYLSSLSLTSADTVNTGALGTANNGGVNTGILGNADGGVNTAILGTAGGPGSTNTGILGSAT